MCLDNFWSNIYLAMNVLVTNNRAISVVSWPGDPVTENGIFSLIYMSHHRGSTQLILLYLSKLLLWF